MKFKNNILTISQLLFEKIYKSFQYYCNMLIISNLIFNKILTDFENFQVGLNFVAQYPINTNQLKMLSISPIIAARFTLSKVDYDFAINENVMKKFVGVAKCL